MQLSKESMQGWVGSGYHWMFCFPVCDVFSSDALQKMIKTHSFNNNNNNNNNNDNNNNIMMMMMMMMTLSSRQLHVAVENPHC